MGFIANPTDEDWINYNEYMSSEKDAIKRTDLYRFINDSDRRIIAGKLFQYLPSAIKNKGRSHILEKIGESFAGYCIELWLWEKGYALNGLQGNSFTIDPQCVVGSSRIDFKLEINANSVITSVIDSKNWARYCKKDAVNYVNEHIKSFKSY